MLGGGYQAEMWSRTPWPRKREVGILALLCVALILTGLLPGLLTPAAMPSAVIPGAGVVP